VNTDTKLQIRTKCRSYFFGLKRNIVGYIRTDLIAYSTMQPSKREYNEH